MYTTQNINFILRASRVSNSRVAFLLCASLICRREFLSFVQYKNKNFYCIFVASVTLAGWQVRRGVEGGGEADVVKALAEILAPTHVCNTHAPCAFMALPPSTLTLANTLRSLGKYYSYAACARASAYKNSQQSQVGVIQLPRPPTHTHTYTPCLLFTPWALLFNQRTIKPN